MVTMDACTGSSLLVCALTLTEVLRPSEEHEKLGLISEEAASVLALKLLPGPS